MSSVYGCHNRKPFAAAYLPTHGDKPIPHVTSNECQYTKSELGQRDTGCIGCTHRIPTTTTQEKK